MQPKMNKRKSVSKMTEKDAKDATKYVLTHQTVDAEGDLETNLVKVIVLLLHNLTTRHKTRVVTVHDTRHVLSLYMTQDTCCHCT